MDRLIPILTIVALVAAWNLFLYRQSRGRAWSPLWMAFSATAAAVIFLVAGTIGYTLDRHDRFVAHTAWAGGVIWWEIGAGLGTALLAAYFWRKGLQSIRPL
jgi:hypothetical protein